MMYSRIPEGVDNAIVLPLFNQATTEVSSVVPFLSLHDYSLRNSLRGVPVKTVSIISFTHLANRFGKVLLPMKTETLASRRYQRPPRLQRPFRQLRPCCPHTPTKKVGMVSLLVKEEILVFLQEQLLLHPNQLPISLLMISLLLHRRLPTGMLGSHRLLHGRDQKAYVGVTIMIILWYVKTLVC